MESLHVNRNNKMFSVMRAMATSPSSLLSTILGEGDNLISRGATWHSHCASCFSLVQTPLMSPNKSQHILVEKCDSGPLIFNVNKNLQLDWTNQWSKYVIQFDFHSFGLSPPVMHLPLISTQSLLHWNHSQPKDDNLSLTRQYIRGATSPGREFQMFTLYIMWSFSNIWVLSTVKCYSKLNMTHSRSQGAISILQHKPTCRNNSFFSWQTIWLEFRSSVIEDASPPTCTINFNGTFVLPSPGNEEDKEYPLPGCFTGDSREGYHMTYYWFYLYTWPGRPHGLVLPSG